MTAAAVMPSARSCRRPAAAGAAGAARARAWTSRRPRWRGSGASGRAPTAARREPPRTAGRHRRRRRRHLHRRRRLRLRNLNQHQHQRRHPPPPPPPPPPPCPRTRRRARVRRARRASGRQRMTRQQGTRITSTLWYESLLFHSQHSNTAVLPSSACPLSSLTSLVHVSKHPACISEPAFSGIHSCCLLPLVLVEMRRAFLPLTVILHTLHIDCSDRT